MITDILRPETARDAVRAKSAPGAAYLGGGTWLNAGRAPDVRVLISLERLGLSRIVISGGSCTVGATVTLQQIIDSPEAPSALKEAARMTASRTLRNMQTVGGELGLSADDSALIPVLMVLDTTVLLAGSRKPMPIEELLKSPQQDLILGVIIHGRGRPCAVRGLSRTSHGPRSLVVAVSLGPGGAESGKLREARAVVSDCRGRRVRLLETGVHGAPLPSRARLEELVAAMFRPQPDMHASVAYKAYMAGVMVADSLHALAAPGAKA